MDRYRLFSTLRHFRTRAFSLGYVLYLRVLGVSVPFSVTFYTTLEIRGSGHTIRIGENVIFQTNVRLNTILKDGRWGSITIGDNVTVGDGTIISSMSQITIGTGCRIAAYCYFVDFDHETAAKSVSTQPIILENNVWLGTHAVILRGVTIGSKSVVGAGSVVTRSIPQCTVAVGLPAKPVVSGGK